MLWVTVTGTVTCPSGSVAVTISCRDSSLPGGGAGAVNRTVASALPPGGTSTAAGENARLTTPSGSVPANR